jgi:putative Mg2+ transporter-C (MgtC) family protein
MSDLAVLGKMLLAIVVGGAIGFERELADRPAGLRTHMLVAATATLLVSLADLLVSTFTPAEVVTSDPIRIFEAIIVGVSFLGAGTIFRSRDRSDPVQGLTTAASILFTAVLGIAIALEKFGLAVAAALIVLLINFGIGQLTGAFKARAASDDAA